MKSLFEQKNTVFPHTVFARSADRMNALLYQQEYVKLKRFRVCIQRLKSPTAK
jgi:hypothetical protein